MSSPRTTRSSAASTAADKEEDSWYLALEPSHKHLSKDVGYRKQVQLKLQKKPHVLDVQGVRRIAHLYGSTAMFASQAKSNSHHWGNLIKNHKAALDQAHDLIEKEGYTHSRTRNAAKTVYAPAQELEDQGFQPDIGGPISDQKAFELIQTYPQPFHSKQLPLRLELNWDTSNTLHESDDEQHTTPPSRAQELFTTPHRADKMAPAKTPRKRTRGDDSEGGDFEEAIAAPDDIVAIHTLTTFAKDACSAEEKLTWMQEVYPYEPFLKNFLEAVKILPGSISTVEAIVERYSNKATTASPRGSFLDRVRNTLPRAAADNRDVYEVRRPISSPTNPFYLDRNEPFQRPPPTQGQSAYAIRPQDRVSTSQAPSDAAFYKDLTKDLAKLAPPNPIERYGDTKTVTMEGKGKILLVGLVSRTDSWVLPELWVKCIEKFLEDFRTEDLAATSLNFWAGVLHLQDIKTRFGHALDEHGAVQKRIPDEAYNLAAAAYAAVDSTAVARKLGRAMAFYRREQISNRDKFGAPHVQRELVKLEDDQLSEVLGFFPSQPLLGDRPGGSAILNVL